MTLGMRATKSDDAVLDGAFVPDRYVAGVVTAGAAGGALLYGTASAPGARAPATIDAVSLPPHSRPAPDEPGPSRSVFELAVRVAAADLDAQAHVNNVVYVRWVQDAAVAHWEALTTPDIQAEVGWVLLRHEIDYRRPAVLDDAVVVRTAVGHLAGLTFERLTEIRRPRDGAVLAHSRTLWCPVDPRSGRPRRVSPELRALFALAGPPAGEAPPAA